MMTMMAYLSDLIMKDKFNQNEEVVSVLIRRTTFEGLIRYDLLSSSEYEIKVIEPYKEEYKDDPYWVALKKESNDAYKKLKEYEFNKRP